MNAFGEWMARHGLRQADVARAFGLIRSSVHSWQHSNYWPRTRSDALRMVHFTGGEVTPDQLLGQDLFDSRESPDAQLGREAIQLAQQRMERKNAERKKRLARTTVD